MKLFNKRFPGIGGQPVSLADKVVVAVYYLAEQLVYSLVELRSIVSLGIKLTYSCAKIILNDISCDLFVLFLALWVIVPEDRIALGDICASNKGKT